MHVESVVERRAENVLRVGRQMIPHGGLQVVIYGVRHDGVASRNGIEAIAAEKLLPHPSCIVACQRIVGQHPPHKPSSKEMSPHEERRFCWPRAKCGAGPDRAISVARGTRRRESLNKRTGLAAKELAAGRHKQTIDLQSHYRKTALHLGGDRRNSKGCATWLGTTGLRAYRNAPTGEHACSDRR